MREVVVKWLDADIIYPISDNQWVRPTQVVPQKSPIGMSPYRLVFEKVCHLRAEVEHHAYWVIKKFNFDMVQADSIRRLQLNKLEEPHNETYENARIYKSRTKGIS